MASASTKNAGAARGTRQASTAAAANAIAVCPDGNEWLCGIVTSELLSERTVLTDSELDHGRDPVGGRIPRLRRARTGAPVARATASTNPITSQTIPYVPTSRQPDEDVVERMPPVVDDPTLHVAVPAGQALSIQTGAICFVWSISCCRSNGLPTNACAPLVDACASALSSTLPLNITTGIAPAPYCS